VSLLARVTAILVARAMPHAVIGAAALAVHGVPRATGDVDVLVTDPSCLRDDLWEPLTPAGVQVEIRRGDATDPLAGVVRFSAAGEPTVDLIVGRHGWQGEVLGRAVSTAIGDATVPVVQAADLILLKLYAGGPQDAWDVDQLLDVVPGLVREIDARIPALPDDSVALWQRILAQRSRP
jgi:hypothetical protein